MNIKSLLFPTLVFFSILFILQVLFPVRELFLSPTPCLNSTQVQCGGVCVSDCPNGMFPTGACKP